MSTKTPTFVDPFDSAEQRAGAGVLGMWLFILVVVMIFVATILGYLVVRFDRPPGQEWVPEGAPRLPAALLLSTMLLLGSSATMQSAVSAARLDQFARVRHAMVATLVLALLFLGVQFMAWVELWRAHATIDTGLYAWTFYVLTGLHALHVLGGLPPMVVATRRAMHNGYGAADHAGLVRCAMYWHALDAIWLVLYLTLWLGS